MNKNLIVTYVLYNLLKFRLFIIISCSISFINSLQMLSVKVEEGQVTAEQVEEILGLIQQRTFITLTVAGVVFAVIGIISAVFLSRFVIYPINKLIKRKF